MSKTIARNHEGQTASMRESINSQIQAWASRGKWVDNDKADRLFKEIDRHPEKFINPDPTTCGSYREEASRIYGEIKEDYGLKKVSEVRSNARDYESQRKAHAVQKLRENFEAIEAGECDELVEDIEDEYGPEFVAEVLADERLERRMAESQTDESGDNEAANDESDSDSETMSTKTHTPLSNQSESRLGNALIAAGEWMNNRDSSVRSLWGTTKQVAYGICTMPVYLLFVWVTLAPIYFGLKGLVLTGKAVVWTGKAIWWLLSFVPKAFVLMTDVLEGWLVKTVTQN